MRFVWIPSEKLRHWIWLSSNSAKAPALWSKSVQRHALVIWNWGLVFPVTSKCPTSVSRIDILLLRYTRIFCCHANSILVTRKRFSQVTALQELRGQWQTAKLINFPWKRSFHFSLHPKRQQRGLKIPRLEPERETDRAIALHPTSIPLTYEAISEGYGQMPGHFAPHRN